MWMLLFICFFATLSRLVFVLILTLILKLLLQLPVLSVDHQRVSFHDCIYIYTVRPTHVSKHFSFCFYLLIHLFFFQFFHFFFSDWILIFSFCFLLPYNFFSFLIFFYSHSLGPFGLLCRVMPRCLMSDQPNS